MSTLDEAVTPARLAAAHALRQLGHALVGHQVDDALLQRVADSALSILPLVEAGDQRSRPIEAMKREMFQNVAAEGEEIQHFPDCIISGMANPMGVGVRVHIEGEGAVARVVLGAAFEGAPGRAHGGVVAAVFDDVMGYVLMLAHTPAYTGELSVSYLAPTPMGVEVEFRATLRRRDGRKLWIEGEARAHGQRIAVAEGLFIAIPPDRFGAKQPAEEETE